MTERLEPRSARPLALLSTGAFLAAALLLPAVAGASAILISVNSDGTDSGGNTTPGVPPDSGWWVLPQISDDARFVLHGGYAADLVTTTYGLPQVFVRDTWNKTTQLVNLRPDGESGNAKSYYASMTPEGRYVVFQTESTDLDAKDLDSWTDVYLRDLDAQTTTLVSVNNDGDVGDASSSGPVITPDARYVAFTSSSDNLAPNATNNNVYVRDLQSEATILVSTNSAGTGGGNDNSRLPSGPIAGRGVISDDGRYVVFKSNASDLVGTGAHGGENVYVRDLVAGATEMVSINALGTFSGDGGSNKPSMTPDGRYVVFTSASSDLVLNDLNGNLYDVFVRDRLLGLTLLVSVNALGTASGDGESGVFWPAPQITPDGRYVAFVSYASDLTLISDPGGGRDVFVRDLLLQTTTLVSVNAAGTATGNGSSAEPRITPDGRYVFFTSAASDLVAGDGNGVVDLFVRDMVLGTTKLLSRNTDGDPANGGVGASAIDPSGMFVAFASNASDMVDTDTNEAMDVFWLRAFPELAATGIPDADASPVALGFRALGLAGSQTTFRLELGAPGTVEIAVYDIAGRLVTTVVRAAANPGGHSYAWDGRALGGTAVASGIYFAQAVVRSAGETRTRTIKFALVR